MSLSNVILHAFPELQFLIFKEEAVTQSPLLQTIFFYYLKY